MKALQPEDIERYSAYLSPFYESAEAKKATVLALHSIFTSVIDNAFGKSVTDMALEENRLKDHFQSSVSHASLRETQEVVAMKLEYEVPPSAPKSKRGFEP